MRRQVKAIVAITAALMLSVAFGATFVSATPPVVSMDPPTASYTTIQVSGEVDPEDNGTYVYGEYSKDPINEGWQYEYLTFLEAGEPQQPVAGEITALAPGIEYHVRLAAKNFIDPDAYSTDETVTTAAVDPPTVESGSATAVEYTTAHLGGSINPNESPIPIDYHFEYTTDPSQGWSPDGFGQISEAEAAGNSPIAIGADITGLSPGTSYQFRLVASNGNTYPSDPPHPTFETKAVGAPVIALDPVTTFTGTTAHFSGKIDPDAPAGNPTAFNVNWHLECTPGCPDLDGDLDPVPAGPDPVVIEADASGLNPNTSYEVTLVASNVGGQVSAGPASFKTDQVAPEILPLWAGEVDSDSAVLAAKLNPRNGETTYQFEWGTNDSYGNTAPATSQPLGAEDNEFHLVTAPVSGLQPDTQYRFRVVATNVATSAQAEGVDHGFTTLAPGPSDGSCPNEALRSGPSADLQDCRAYELVTPPDKGGYGAKWLPATAVSPDGGAVAYFGDGAFPGSGAESAIGGLETYIAKRRDGGWDTQSIAPSLPPIFGTLSQYNYRCFTPSLSKGFLSASAVLTPGAEPDVHNAYFRDLPRGPFDLLTPPALDVDPLPPSGGGFGSVPQIDFPACAKDLSQVAFRTTRKLTPDAPPSSTELDDRGLRLYQWVGGDLHYAAVLPNGTRWQEGSRPGSLTSGGTAENAISDDGSRLFFTLTGGDPSNPLDGELYARDNATSTIHVSASQRTTPDPAADGTEDHSFLGATPDGENAFFIAQDKLTDDATTGPTDEGCDLYRWTDGSPPTLTDLTPSSNPADPNGAGVGLASCSEVGGGLLGHSVDGSRIYFMASGSLAPGAMSGQPNLYLWENGETRLVATLAASDARSWRSPPERQPYSRVTPDAAHALFTTTAQLTSYDNAGHLEVYLYDADSDELTCVSCDPQGTPSTADASLVTVDRPQGAVADAQPGNLSDDGKKVYFETAQALVPTDSNGRADVYEWSDGHIGLISSGKSEADSSFVGADPSGENVFFRTRERLVGWDTDDSFDIYDARADGGLPAPQLPSAPCSAEACREAGGVTPAAGGGPTTSGFVGPGNYPPKRCRPGKVRRGKHCVRHKRKGSAHRHNANTNRRNGR